MTSGTRSANFFALFAIAFEILLFATFFGRTLQAVVIRTFEIVLVVGCRVIAIHAYNNLVKQNQVIR